MPLIGWVNRPIEGLSGTCTPSSSSISWPMVVAGTGVAGASRMSQSAITARMLSRARPRTRWAWFTQAAGSRAPASSRSWVSGSYSSYWPRRVGRCSAAPSEAVIRKAAARQASAMSHSTTCVAPSVRGHRGDRLPRRGRLLPAEPAAQHRHAQPGQPAAEAGRHRLGRLRALRRVLRVQPLQRVIGRGQVADAAGEGADMVQE